MNDSVAYFALVVLLMHMFSMFEDPFSYSGYTRRRWCTVHPMYMT